MDSFVIHACEQVLRFTTVDTWDDLSEERKVQLGFNMGVVAHGLELSKEDGFQVFSNAREGVISMSEFHEHIKSLVDIHNIPVEESNISRPF